MANDKKNNTSCCTITSVLQRVDSEAKMLEIYDHLKEINHVNIARPIHIYDQVTEQKAKPHDYFLCFHIGEGKNLEEFVKDNKKLFFNYYKNDKEDTACSVSSLYVTILRGLVQGLKRLQKSKISADLSSLANIYVVGDHDEDEEKQVHCVFTKYYVRKPPSNKRVRNQKGKQEDRKITEWGNLATRIEALNKLINLKSSHPVAPEIDSFIKILRIKELQHRVQPPAKDVFCLRSVQPQDSPTDIFWKRIEQIQYHPIFWEWRKRKDLICYASDILKNLERLMYKQSRSQRSNQTRLPFSWNLSILNHPGTVGAFGDDDFSCLEPFEEGNLKKLKRNADEYHNAKMHANETTCNQSASDPGTSSTNKQYTCTDGKGKEEDTKPKNPKDIDRRKILSDCIHLMRNIYCHLSSNKGNPYKTDISIKDAKELEKLFSQAYPKLILGLAEAIADHEEKTSSKWSEAHGPWEHGEWPLHF